MANNSRSTAKTRKVSSARARQARTSPRIRKATIATPNRKTRTRAPRKSSSPLTPSHKKTTEPNFTFYTNPTLTLICVPSRASAHFSLEDAAHITGVHAEMLRYYCRAGLIKASRGMLDTDPFFDDATLLEIRRIEHYRRHLGVGLQALPLICKLQRESERLQIGLNFLLSDGFCFSSQVVQ